MMIDMTNQKTLGYAKEGRDARSAAQLKRTLVGAVLAVETVLMAKPATAEETREDTKGRIFVNSFDHMKTTSVAVALERGFELPGKLRVDASMALSSPGNTVELESAELDLTTPKLGPLSLTTYIYKDRFYFVERGIGAVAHINDFHVGTEYAGDNIGISYARYRFKIADDTVRLAPQLALVYSNKQVESLGAQLAAEVDVDGVTLFAKAVHFRSLHTGDWMNGNMQGGMLFSF
jgi:hypothetical protein